MGLFCMIFGALVFLAFLFAGYCLASMLVSAELINMLSGTTPFSFGELFKVPTSADIGTYIACVCVLGFIGLMIGLGLFMHGMIYSRITGLEKQTRKLSRRISG